MQPTTIVLARTLCVAALMLACVPTMAADKSSKESAATRRLEQQLRAAKQEKDQLTQEKTGLEGQLKEAQTKAAEAHRRTQSASARNAELTKELEAARASIAAVTADKDALAAKLAETERKLGELRLDKQRVELTLAGEQKTHGECRARNAKMYALGNELIDRYEHKTCSDAMLQSEPFTGIKRAQIEKMIELDREQLDKNELLPAPSTNAAQ